MSSTVPSLAQIRASLPPEKDRLDSLWLRCVLRKLSFPVTCVFIRLRFSANYVSYLSILVAFCGTIMMSVDNHFAIILGACIFNLWALLDCVDGNIARVKQQASEFGAFVDAMSGYVAYAFVFLGMGIAAEHMKPLIPAIMNHLNFVIIGSLTSILQLTTRLIYKKFVEVSKKATSGKASRLLLVSANLGVTGLLMPFVLLGAIFSLIHWVGLFYLAYWGIGFAYLLVTKIVGIERMQKAEER